MQAEPTGDRAVIPGQRGSVYTYRQLEQLWTAAGGSAKLAPLMAAIAEAESGGNPRVQNPSGAKGLWQINGLPFAGDVWDPQTNARMAVAKYKSQGLKAWQSYTNKSYKKFLQGKAPGNAGVTGGAGFVDEAKQFLGTPYVWGGDKPGGFDCSGLVQYALQKIGVKNVPRTSEQQWLWVRHIPRSELKPGDLVFYAGSDGTPASPGHVAIYAGNDQIIQAPQTGEDVQQIPMPSGAVGYGQVPGIARGDFTGTPGGGRAGAQSAELTSLTLPSWAGSIPFVGPLFSIFGDVADMTGIPQTIGHIANSITAFEAKIAWFFVPSHWVRIFCGVAGSALILGGIITMSRTGKANSIQYPVKYQGASAGIPYPGGQIAPAFGIAQVTVGAILLFVALHNLPLDVEDFGGLVSYLQAELQNQGAS